MNRLVIGLTALLGFAWPYAASCKTAQARDKVPLAVRVQGSTLVDGRSTPLVLRGVNISGLEDYAIQGWAWNGNHTAYEPWGGDRPKWSAILGWKTNVVRIPLNEASWLGLTTYDHDGKPRQADPGRNYRSAVAAAVREATSAGLYVILDLHWNGPNVVVPGKSTPVPQTPFEGGGGQNPMADLDHSLGFWATVANSFKNNPAVMFELFNEPYFWWLEAGKEEWSVWRDGGTLTQYVTGTNPYQITYSWQTAGMQQMINAVRSTGATNVVIVGGVNWCGEMSGWLAHRPVDPLNQMAAAWHAYPNPKDPARPAHGTVQYVYVQEIAAAVPVIISETGDHNTPGTVGSPFVSEVLPWADQHEISYLGWTWDAWQNPDNVLIKDANGTPSDGFGKYYRDHLLCVAAQTVKCP